MDSISDLNKFVELLNTQAARGNTWVGSAIINRVISEIFVNDNTGATYQYLIDGPIKKNFTGLATALDIRGAQGYAYAGSRFSNGENGEMYLLYRKNIKKPTTYTYQITDFIDEYEAALKDFNAQGTRGFSYSFSLYATDTDLFNPIIRNFGVYIKNASDTATYSYEYKTVSNSSTRESALAEINAMGQKSFIWHGQDRLCFRAGFGCNVDPAFRFSRYSKVSTNSGGISYELADTISTNAANLITQMNHYAARGYLYAGTYQLWPAINVNAYYKGPSVGF